MRKGQNRRGRDRNPEYYEPQNDAGARNEADPNAWDDQYQEAYEDSYAWNEAGSDAWDNQSSNLQRARRYLGRRGTHRLGQRVIRAG